MRDAYTDWKVTETTEVSDRVEATEFDEALSKRLTQKAAEEHAVLMAITSGSDLEEFRGLGMDEAMNVWNPSTFNTNPFLIALESEEVPAIANSFKTDIFLEELERYTWKRAMPGIYEKIMTIPEPDYE